mmetsp:Transcript_9368/g.17259  ORF Transcript_9368/g.17259 Transcript_9368/m.17259 type:complete len:1422 (-) Transcript_9368:53-4318(-)
MGRSREPASELVPHAMEGESDAEDDHDVEVHVAESAKQDGGVSREVTASWFSWITFSWVGALLAKGQRVRKKENRELELGDLWKLPHADETGNLSRRFEASQSKWKAKKKKREGTPLTPKETSRQLTSGLWQLVRQDAFKAGLCKLISTLGKISYPLLLNQVLQVVQGIADSPVDRQVRAEDFVWVAIFGLCLALSNLAENLYVAVTVRSSWQVRSTLTTAVYRKTLKLSSSSRQVMTTGQIVNFMQLDAGGMSIFPIILHEVWSIPLQLIGYLTILYFYIDWATFTSFAVLLVTMLPATWLFFKLVKYQKRWATHTDERVLRTNEILQSMQGVKMGGWELQFVKSIEQIRKLELKQALSIAFVMAGGFGTLFSVPTLAAVTSLITYAAADLGQIDAATLFTALSAFALLQDPVTQLPDIITIISEWIIRRARLSKFLAMKEVSQHGSEEDLDSDPPAFAISITNGTFFWGDPSEAPKELLEEPEASKANTQDKKDDSKSDQVAEEKVVTVDEEAERKRLAFTKPALVDVNLHVKPGALVGVCGAVASGKTSLCNAIINEMYTESGQVKVHGNVAYCAQTPWVFHGSIRENILFGEPFQPSRYQKVLQACQLAHDLELLEEGDQTVVGEQGINLSGGQKARVSLARAAYSSKSIVILDDPLSALDPGVASKVFEQCIAQLLKDRTRIVVTNQLNVLPKCDQVVVLATPVSGEPGHIVEQGRYSVLSRSGLEFSKLISSYSGGNHENHQADTKEASSNEAIAVVSSGNKGEELVEKEERQKGAVTFATYLFYIRAGGGVCLAFVILLPMFLMQFVNLGKQAVVTIWVDDALNENYSLQVYLGAYGGSGALFFVITTAAIFFVSIFALRASRTLYNNLMLSIVRAPMSFFDVTPTGRILARFSKDLNFVDRAIPGIILMFLFLVSSCLVALGAIAFVTPLFLIMFPLLFPVYVLLLQYYRPTMRDLKRMDSISRSPIYSHYSESISGLTTIRAFNSSQSFETTNSNLVDVSIRAFYLLKFTELWIFLRLAMMGSSITIFAGSFAVYGATTGTLSPGLAGLSLTFAISITDMLGGVVRTISEVEAGFNAVERIKYYTKNIPQEKPFTSKNPPKKSWPKKGGIEITDLKMRYRPELPLVLKGISLSIQGGERIGVVGRTGCGKSSLMLALMRLVEPEVNEDGSGPVVIDGIDVSKIGLHELRKKVSIVPQNPMLFSGTIRSNMDPFDAYKEDKMWEALEACTLKNAVTELGGLDSPVSEFGGNLSQGQRQLLVLSRALLNNTRILLLDEATSSLDHASDVAIQKSLRTSFKKATCITIAHRLQTVVDSDRILVLDSGSVLEYDSPAELLNDPNSAFSGMVAELGPKLADRMRRKARGSLGRLSESDASSSSSHVAVSPLAFDDDDVEVEFDDSTKSETQEDGQAY